jgi:predicted negative regulator of RcsB-dependent stress response
VLAGGHEGLQARLKALDLELALTPTAALHLERADIKRRLGKLNGAMKDAAAAAHLGGDVALVRGRIHVAAKRWREAEADLAASPAERAVAREKLGNIAGAITDYRAVLGKGARPDHILALGRLLQAAGKPKEAVDALKHGLPAIVVRVALVNALAKTNRHKEALAQIDEAMQRLKVKATWRIRRGDVLRAAGREKQAKKEYRAALKELATLKKTASRAQLILDAEARLK